MDESRFGLFTRNGKALTALGIKPICSFHQVFKSTYLFGAFSPIDGQSFMLELPKCNAETFQIYLNELSASRPDEFKVLIVDNGAFHKAKQLVIPPDICLLFLPPYSPELNPAEKMWAKFKRAFTNKLFHTLDEVSEFIITQTGKLTADEVQSICHHAYIFAGADWTN